MTAFRRPAPSILALLLVASLPAAARSAGYSRTFADLTERLEKSSRQAFAKVSYAWQR
jgi:hypothetical protein